MSTPTTLDEAKAHKYHHDEYDPARCAEEVARADWHWSQRQCLNPNGKGLNGLFCGTHAKRYPAKENDNE